MGGDVLDFIHKIKVNNLHAERPQGPDLEVYVADLATALGYDYPACAKAIEMKTQEMTGLRLSRRELLEATKQILREVRNPAEQQLALMDLADRSGLYRMNAKELKMLAHRDSLYGSVQKSGLRVGHGWSEQADLEDFVIPGLLRRPSQVMVHARGGVGKTEMMLALAKAVGRGETIKIRGLDVPCKQGRVLWFSNDQGKSRLAAMLQRQGIEENGRDKHWFELVCDWRMDMHEEFRELVMEYKPTLIVMDSLGTMMEGIAKENEGDYADWIYQMSKLNGDMTVEAGFPACSIVWIHHNTKSDDNFRGSDRLMNAMEETWALRALTVEEETELGVNNRILTIGKSRFDRGGDRLIIHRDLEFNFSISDMTPLVQREGVNRTGDSTPETLVLAILAASEGSLTRKAIQEALHARMRGEGRAERDLPSEWGVRKYLSLWLGEGLIEEVLMPSSGGRPGKGYVSRGKDTSLLTESPLDAPEAWPALAFEHFDGAHKKSPLTESLTESPTEGGEGPDGVTHSGTGLSVGCPDQDAPHRKSAPENACAAGDPEGGGLSVSSDVSFKGDPPADPTPGDLDESPRTAGDLHEAPALERPGAEPSDGGSGGGQHPSAVEGVRLARVEEDSAGDRSAAAPGSDGRPPCTEGVGDPGAGGHAPVLEACQEPQEAPGVGEAVPGGQDDDGAALGADEPLEVHDGLSPDGSALSEPAPAQAVESSGMVGAGTSEESQDKATAREPYFEDDLDFEAFA